jgi:hypothetical protein
MKPSLSTLKNARGRIVAHAASLGPIRVQGATAKEASDACEKACADALVRLDRGTYLGTWRGHAFIVFPDAYGWSYWLDTFTGGYSVSCLAIAGREATIDNAIGHLAQVLWSHDTDDAEFVASLPPSLRNETQGWIVFQRAYARFRAEGHSETECHRLACEFKVAS